MGIPAVPDREYEIIAPSSLSERAHARDAEGDSAYHVTFLGRESMLPAPLGGKTIVLDKIASLRRVPMAKPARH